MSEVATIHHQQPMTPAPAQSALLQTDTFNQMWRVAMAMARSALCPKHLRAAQLEETAATCLRVVNQAYRWGFDPFAVADESYVVHGKLGYQGKLVAAVVNSRGGLEERLSFAFKGEGDGRTVTVSGRFRGQDEAKSIDLSVKQAKTDNDMWKKDPDQKLCYSGSIKWARRYCPELILGVLTDDDLERIACQPVEAGNGSVHSVASGLDDLAGHIEQTLAPKRQAIEAKEEPSEPAPQPQEAPTTLPGGDATYEAFRQSLAKQKTVKARGDVLAEAAADGRLSENQMQLLGMYAEDLAAAK